MRIIKPSFEILTKIDGDKILKDLEIAGRTCYQSCANITDESAKKFILSIIKNKHFTILEHKSISVKVVCDRGVGYEIIRHRLASYSQESTRYCNFSKDKFGNEITYIKPFFWECSDDCDCIIDTQRCTNRAKYEIWEKTMKYIEEQYMRLIGLGATAQEARSVLPNSLKTEIVITMNLRQWRHFFNLRAVGTTGKPHPQMLEIAMPMLKKFQELIPIIFDDLTDVAEHKEIYNIIQERKNNKDSKTYTLEEAKKMINEQN